MSEVTLSVAQGIATITMNRPRSLNAITADDYDKLANTLREVDKREDVIATIWQATGKWFCAGTDVKSTGSKLVETTVRHALVNQVSKSHLDCGHAFASHSKILIAVLNGPAMGIAAGMCTNEVSFLAALIQIQPSWDILISSTRYPTPGYPRHSRSLV
ncbi:hypothetical protein PTI98_003250 [Pleurotus ostreatus]|nr:hypothetical protein PTI98_003250 [Pleurotus ostreatus]